MEPFDETRMSSQAGRRADITPEQFATFGELVGYLRRRAGLTLHELSIAVGYSEAHLSRLEHNQRAPEPATIAARFVPALHVQGEPEWIERLLDLANGARQAKARPPAFAPSSAASLNPPPQDGGLYGQKEGSGYSQNVAAPAYERPALPKPWHEVWWIALTRPSVTAYEELAEDPRATSRRAYGWVVASGLLSGFVMSSVGAKHIELIVKLNQISGPSVWEFIKLQLFLYLAGPVLAAVSSLFWLALGVWLVQWIARALGGTGTYSRLIYLFAAFHAPLGPVQALTSVQSCLYMAGWALWLYGVVLSVISVKAINKLGWGRAWVSVLPLLAVTLGTQALRQQLAAMGVFG
jgi:transcriptional regulator with XRE-family HTH domain